MRIFTKTNQSLLRWTILILAVAAGHALASRSPQAQPIVDAGPPKTLALPETEVTLFGHSGDPLHDTIAWTLVSGPGPVHFSAPWALATTFAATVPGTYTVQLQINGSLASTARTTVTVNPASSQTAFYVDPSALRFGDGSARLPWKHFEDGNDDETLQWDAINHALASSDVIVYFSARHADEDTAEEIVVADPYPGAVVRVQRTDTSAHRLTLDGESLYNTNPFLGAWAPNTGSNRMRLNNTTGCCISIGWDNDASYDYVTIRGFEVTGTGARIRWGGSYTVLEDMWVRDVQDLGATVQFNSALVDGTCIPLGIDHDVTLRHNLIERGIGEAIYIASNYNAAEDSGCVDGPFSGDNHYDFLVENNTITDPGFHGGEGDGIDFKAGIYNVTIRGNHISMPDTLYGSGISTLGRMPNSTHLSNYLIESNIIEHPAPNYVGITLNGLNGAIARNNVIRNCGPVFYGSIVAQARQPGLTPGARQLQIVNNTIDICGPMGFTEMEDAPFLRNNLFLTGILPSITGSDPHGIDSDFNLFATTLPYTPEGADSIPWPTTDGIVVARGVDEHLLAPSPFNPAVGQGIPILNFSVDIEGNPRRSDVWDIGAYAFIPQ